MEYSVAMIVHYLKLVLGRSGGRKKLGKIKNAENKTTTCDIPLPLLAAILVQIFMFKLFWARTRSVLPKVMSWKWVHICVRAWWILTFGVSNIFWATLGCGLLTQSNGCKSWVLRWLFSVFSEFWFSVCCAGIFEKYKVYIEQRRC